MQGIKRRVIYVVFYELITLLIISTAFSFFSGKDAGHSTTLGVVVVMLAVVWNTVYNTLFEMWGKKQTGSWKKPCQASASCHRV
ncbi:chlorhexidine efflux transporter [Vreelandella alkaliphila]|uniref:chlorhexidine efflux transporter n=1 Tax=Vreelandella alkaliphila TaxID=272774 RepID=UPI003F9C74AB